MIHNNLCRVQWSITSLLHCFYCSTSPPRSRSSLWILSSVDKRKLTRSLWHQQRKERKTYKNAALMYDHCCKMCSWLMVHLLCFSFFPFSFLFFCFCFFFFLARYLPVAFYPPLQDLRKTALITIYICKRSACVGGQMLNINLKYLFFTQRERESSLEAWMWWADDWSRRFISVTKES